MSRSATWRVHPERAPENVQIAAAPLAKVYLAVAAIIKTTIGKEAYPFCFQRIGCPRRSEMALIRA
jgi:hypothetical protein